MVRSVVLRRMGLRSASSPNRPRCLRSGNRQSLHSASFHNRLGYRKQKRSRHYIQIRGRQLGTFFRGQDRRQRFHKDFRRPFIIGNKDIGYRRHKDRSQSCGKDFFRESGFRQIHIRQGIFIQVIRHFRTVLVQRRFLFRRRKRQRFRDFVIVRILRKAVQRQKFLRFRQLFVGQHRQLFGKLPIIRFVIIIFLPLIGQLFVRQFKQKFKQFQQEFRQLLLQQFKQKLFRRRILRRRFFQKLRRRLKRRQRRKKVEQFQGNGTHYFKTAS